MAGAKFSILVVEDDESMRYMLEQLLFQSGYNVTTAANGTHAIQILRSKKTFELVICDMKMPLQGGVDFVKYMRENKIETPVVMMTGYPEREKIVQAAQYGIKDIMLKPFKSADLLKTVRLKLGLEEDPRKASGA